MPVDKKQTRFVQASMRIMFRLGGSTKRPMPGCAIYRPSG